MQIANLRMRRIFLSTGTLSALVFGAGIASATQDVMLTTVMGNTSIQDREISERAELGEDQELKTGEDAGCSVLLDRNAVVELCGQTRVSFAKDAKRGNRIVNVESGELRLIVEPREANERIEIHTPAAIATILGTVVYISVDPLTGATTISSSESEVNIRARDAQECSPRGLPPEPGIPECAEGTTIRGLEQLTVIPGERQQSAKKLSQQQIDALGGCLLDFHDLALEVDRLPQETKAAERVAAVDVAAVVLPTVSAEAAVVVVPVETGADPETEVELQPTDTEDPPTPPMEMQPPCGGPPADTCAF